MWEFCAGNMKRKLIGFVTTSLHLTGLKLLEQKTPYHQRWILLGLFLYYTWANVSTIVLSLVNDDTSIYNYINPIPYVSICVVITSGIATIVKYRTHLSEMLRQMDENLYVYPDEHLLDMKYDWYLDEGNLIIAMVAIFCIQISNVIFLCIPAVVELCNYGEIKSFIYPGWCPWTTEGVGLQLANMAVQFFGVISGLCLNQMILMPVLLALCEFLRQYKRLKKAIVTLKDRSESMGKDFDRKMKRNIINCVKHMQKLRKNFSLFEIWFSKLISWELAVCAFSVAIGLYLMTSAASLSKIYNLIIVIVFMNVNLFARCLMGEIFFDLNEDIADTVFMEIEWYSLSKENQKLLVMFHQMACQPLALFGFKIFVITRVMFARITRTTYSIFNVIKVSLNK